MFRTDVEVAGFWPDLVSRLDAEGALARWSAVRPGLRGLVSVADLAQVTGRGCDRDRADRVVAALAWWAAADGGDDPDAVLVLLHLLADGVYALAARLADVGEHLVPVVAGELAAQIRAFPWRRRRRGVAAGLLLDTRAALLRELGVSRRRGCDWRRREVLAGFLEEWWPLPYVAAEPTPAQELADLLAWAVRRRVVAVADLRLVWALELLPSQYREGRQAVADRWRITTRTARRRRARTLAALRSAAPDYLAAA